MALCSGVVNPKINFTLRKALGPQVKFTNVKNKAVSMNFKGAPMVITFIRSVRSWTKAVWQWLERANQADIGIRLAELEHPLLKKMSKYCARKVPVYIHLFLYRALKR